MKTTSQEYDYTTLRNAMRASYDASHPSFPHSQPFLIPRDIIAPSLLGLYRLIQPKYPSTRILRLPLFGVLVSWSYWTLQHCRTIGMSYGVVIGLLCAVTMIEAMNTLVFEFETGDVVDKYDGRSMTGKQKSVKDLSNGDIRTSSSSTESINIAIRQTGTTSPATIRPTPFRDISLLLLTYLTIDILKMLMIREPFFLGFTTAHNDLPLVPWIYLRTYYNLLSALGIFSAVFLEHRLLKVIAVHVLGPRWLNEQGLPETYPAVYGPLSSVWNKGLAGFWGTFWHQTFRPLFLPSMVAIPRVFGLQGASYSAKMVRSLIAFTLSGFVHACGTYTSWSENVQPIRSFIFFVLQVPAILLQTICIQRLPTRSRKMCYAMTTIAWLWLTFPLLADDLAAANLWYVEPLPWSPLRSFGFGTAGTHAWPWTERWMQYVKAETGWKSGIAWG